MLLYPIGTTQAITYAVKLLSERIPVTDHPTPEVTHLLLDVPSFGPEGRLRSGEELHTYLERLPPAVTVVGGNLSSPLLEDYHTVDLLKSESYVAMNAAITADCALKVARNALKQCFFDCKVLIIGWGRIGKCLAKYLKDLGADVTVAARKEKDLALLRALDYQAVPVDRLGGTAYDLIFNTAPAPILEKPQKDAVKIDLASVKGMAGQDVIWARGLPGVDAPKSSGALIAKCFLELTGRN